MPSRTSMPRNRVRIGSDQTSRSSGTGCSGTGCLGPAGDGPEHLAPDGAAAGPDEQPVERRTPAWRVVRSRAPGSRWPAGCRPRPAAGGSPCRPAPTRRAADGSARRSCRAASPDRHSSACASDVGDTMAKSSSVGSRRATSPGGSASTTGRSGVPSGAPKVRTRIRALVSGSSLTVRSRTARHTTSTGAATTRWWRSCTSQRGIASSSSLSAVPAMRLSSRTCRRPPCPRPSIPPAGRRSRAST